MSYFEYLPELTNTQVFCCDRGCGVCFPIQQEFDIFVEETLDGEIVKRETELLWVSNCCSTGICVWDYEKDDFILE